MSARSKFLGYNRRPKTLVTSMIIITLIAIMGVITFTSEHSINAQMMMGDRGGGCGNMNTSLTQSMAIAEQSVGNNSIAIAAFDNIVGNDPFSIAAFGEERTKELAGSLVHSIILDTPGTEFYHVIVNPGNGQVLAKQELSPMELENMHLEHSRKVMTDPHLVNGTFIH